MDYKEEKIEEDLVDTKQDKKGKKVSKDTNKKEKI